MLRRGTLAKSIWRHLRRMRGLWRQSV